MSEGFCPVRGHHALVRASAAPSPWREEAGRRVGHCAACDVNWGEITVFGGLSLSATRQVGNNVRCYVLCGFLESDHPLTDDERQRTLDEMFGELARPDDEDL